MARVSACVHARCTRSAHRAATRSGVHGGGHPWPTTVGAGACLRVKAAIRIEKSHETDTVCGAKVMGYEGHAGTGGGLASMVVCEGMVGGLAKMVGKATVRVRSEPGQSQIRARSELVQPGWFKQVRVPSRRYTSR